jgi:hypothetical protein
VCGTSRVCLLFLEPYAGDSTFRARFEAPFAPTSMTSSSKPEGPSWKFRAGEIGSASEKKDVSSDAESEKKDAGLLLPPRSIRSFLEVRYCLEYGGDVAELREVLAASSLA